MAPKCPVIKGSKNVKFHPLRAIFRVASANSTDKWHCDNRFLNFAHDDILPAVIGSPLTRKTILPLRILKRSSDRSAKTLRCTQSPCEPLIVAFAFPFARSRAERICQHPPTRSSAHPTRMPRCTHRTCRDSIARFLRPFARPKA